LRDAAASSAAQALRIMASSSGSAIVVPMPRNTVRRPIGLRVIIMFPKSFSWKMAHSERCQG
jgi:hypothetical protein